LKTLPDPALPINHEEVDLFFIVISIGQLDHHSIAWAG